MDGFIILNMFKTRSVSDTHPAQKQDARSRILSTTLELIRETDDPASVTVRQVAARAGVGIGLVNYHFGSRDRLLNEVIGTLMNEEVSPFLLAENETEQDPRSRLINLLFASAEVAIAYPRYAQITVTFALFNSSMDVPLLIVPLIRQMVNPSRTDQEVRWMAYSLVTTLQAALLQYQQFHVYSGINLLDPDQCKAAIIQLVDLIVK
jgi:AcrR family transcriptional regulator